MMFATMDSRWILSALPGLYARRQVRPLQVLDQGYASRLVLNKNKIHLLAAGEVSLTLPRDQRRMRLCTLQ